MSDDAAGSKGTTLVLSVGGSPQPLARAIEVARPGRVVFVVSDGTGNSASSREMVEAASIPYDRRTGESGPGLARIDACPSDHDVISVPPDELDIALARIDDVIAREMRHARAVIADYTGGTKSMTAAMVLAASAHEGVSLQFMAGRRVDLARVAAGTERPVEMMGDLLGTGQLFATMRAFVERRQYGPALSVARDAQRLLKQSSRRVPRGWQGRIRAWVKWLEVLDAWDRFDHAGARGMLQAGLDVEEPWAVWFEDNDFAERLAGLADGNAARLPHPALAEDLWLNAERRAANALYDDAVARLYRLAEAAVQARLWLLHGIDAGNVAKESNPDVMPASSSRQRTRWPEGGRQSLNMKEVCLLLEKKDPDDPVAGMLATQPAWRARRNRSILAHGFSPTEHLDWQDARAWFFQHREILWEKLLDRPTACQLPDKMPVALR